MTLQQMQLNKLAEWLTVAEQRMCEAGAIGSDLEIVRRQVEQHKVFLKHFT